jgi:hypothetical protein
VGIHSNRKPGSIRSDSTRSRRQRRSMRTDCCELQGRAKQLCQVPWRAGSREGAHPLWRRRRRTRTPQKAVHQLRRHHHPHDDQAHT